MDYKTICETDANFLLEFEFLDDEGFAFLYVKKENNHLQYFVNCNGKVFGPFEKASLSVSMGKAQWSVYRDDVILDYSDNGNKCETKKRVKAKKTRGMEIFSQEEIDKLLSAIAEGEAEEPEEEYDEETHILKLHRKKKDIFVTDKKRFGPYYRIAESKYLDEEHFQFTYKKMANSKRWYYNLNGKEIGSFHGYTNMFYDKYNRAILDGISDANYIYINGEKIKCFDSPYNNCHVCEHNGHEIFIARDTARNYHFKRDGIELDISATGYNILHNGDIVYSKKENDTELWFYNETPISVPVNGYDSHIVNSIIKYRRSESKDFEIPYFIRDGLEFQGIIQDFRNQGYVVWLQNGKLLFSLQDFPLVCKDCITNENYYKQRDGNFLRLFYTHRLAGRD